MKKQRRKFTSEFKTQVAIEAIKKRYTLSELARKFDLHPNQISKWKQEFLTKASIVFDKNDSKKNPESDVNIDLLYKKIGELEMEKDFLKKNLRRLNLLK